MMRVSETVAKILLEDGFVIEAIQRGLLNSSAYAKMIHKEVEARTKKSVQLGTIVVALSRLADTIQTQWLFNPKIVIDSFTVTTSLAEVSYERTVFSSEKTASLNNSSINEGDFFTITEGLHEITIICSFAQRDAVIAHFEIKPKVLIDDLVAVSVRFADDYIEVPNTIYSLVGILAARQINLMEIVSTYTELTFVVYKQELEQTVQALNAYTQR